MSENVFVSKEQFAQIKASLAKGVLEQVAIFDALNYNPYDDDVNDQFAAPTIQWRCQTTSQALRTWLRTQLIMDFRQEREAEIKAGSPWTSLEKQLIDDKIFEHDDTTSLSQILTGMKRCSD